MTNRTRAVVALLALGLALGFSGCGDSNPSAPSSPVPPPPVTPVLVRFSEPGTGFSTADLRDAQDQILQLNSANELIWTPDGSRYPGFLAKQGIYIDTDRICQCWLEVRFGSVDGERRAYLTADYGHDNPGTVVDIEVVNGALVVGRTSMFPPGTFVLSGIVTELTPAGTVPVQGAGVYFPLGSGYRGATTDASGFYEIQGLYDGLADVSVVKDGYETASRGVTIAGNTRFDVELVRR